MRLVLGTSASQFESEVAYQNKVSSFEFEVPSFALRFVVSLLTHPEIGFSLKGEGSALGRIIKVITAGKSETYRAPEGKA